VLVLDDADVRRLLDPGIAVAAVRDSLAAHHAGALIAPARLHADLGGGELYVTAGRMVGTGYGFRVYDTMPTTDGDQVTVIYDDVSGRLTGVITGEFLGAARTGAIGAVAVDVLASPDASSLGLIGSGRQAWTQLWAIRAVRSLHEVRVFSRDARRREAFALRARDELGLPAAAVADPRSAVAGADIVVLATSSRQPVIEVGWVGAGAHVTTLGPKLAGANECPADLGDRADVIVTDSVAQVSAYPGPFFLGTPALERIVPLGPAVAGTEQTRQNGDQLTLFCSVGLAGTEVAVAAALLRAAGGRASAAPPGREPGQR
jgi:ornithine cyclodeaminase/alanine dehydrogenase-like protein (mu-crystallin family)